MMLFNSSHVLASLIEHYAAFVCDWIALLCARLSPLHCMRKTPSVLLGYGRWQRYSNNHRRIYEVRFNGFLKQGYFIFPSFKLKPRPVPFIQPNLNPKSARFTFDGFNVTGAAVERHHLTCFGCVQTAGACCFAVPLLDVSQAPVGVVRNAFRTG